MPILNNLKVTFFQKNTKTIFIGLKLAIALIYCISIITIIACSFSKNSTSVNSNTSFSNKITYSLFEIKDYAYFPNDDWKLCYESDKICIYERWIKITDDHFLREKKGEMKVNCNINKAVNTISNHEILKYWMDDVIENTLIKRISATKWITYTVFSLPWPFDKRDIVNENQLKTIIPGYNTQLTINSLDNWMAPKKGITRITKYKTAWNIKKLTNQSVWISYIVSCDNPPPVPRFIQDPVLEKTFHQNLVNLRGFLE